LVGWQHRRARAVGVEHAGLNRSTACFRTVRRVIWIRSSRIADPPGAQFGIPTYRAVGTRCIGTVPRSLGAGVPAARAARIRAARGRLARDPAWLAGECAWMCALRWDSGAVFSALIAGQGPPRSRRARPRPHPAQSGHRAMPGPLIRAAAARRN
jgi:hypothetical protein